MRAQLILAEGAGEVAILPMVRIPRWSRTVRKVQAAVERLFGIRLVILKTFEPTGAASGLVLGETMRQGDEAIPKADFRWVGFDVLHNEQLTDRERLAIVSLTDRTGLDVGLFSRSGWLQDALDWIRCKTGETRDLNRLFQLNASGHTSLSRVQFGRESYYWLKAIAPQVSSEYRFTVELARLFPQFIPRILACRDDWHALLMEDEGVHLDRRHRCTSYMVEQVGTRLAELQIASMKHTETMLAWGFTDLRPSSIRNEIRAAIPLMESAMSQQDLDGVPQLSTRRLKEIGTDMQELYGFVEAMPMRDALIHNDLHLENILKGKTQCVFLDWEQPGVGNPLLAFEQLRSQFDSRPRLQATFVAAYRANLAKRMSVHQFDHALEIMPAFAIAVELQRCLSRASQYQNTRPFFRHIRSLTRQLERALHASVLHNRKRTA